MKLRFLTLCLVAVSVGALALVINETASANNDGPVELLTDSNVAAKHPLPDFSYAGYNHGIGEIPAAKGKLIDVTKYGVTADDDIDDSKAMLKALKAAHDTSGPVVVQLPKGKVVVTEILKIQRSDIVLRGAGSGDEGTNLHFPRPLQMIDKSDSLDELREYLQKYDKRQREKDGCKKRARVLRLIWNAKTLKSLS